MIIFESDRSKFKLRSVFDILAGNRNLFVNKMNEQIILIIWCKGILYSDFACYRSHSEVRKKLKSHANMEVIIYDIS